ncbi:hypothetical protein NFI96_002445 [Prochilodus magdalenae]|nr:hypothetical protein NFI96_002445 [Prochilodus magdalenae]
MFQTGHHCASSKDPMQFAYRQNRSTDDAIALTLHTALSHLDKQNTYVRMLFVEYSSAFNTIVPSRLDIKLRDLGLNSSLCSWILNFLTDRRQNNLSLNVNKTKELIVDFRKQERGHTPITINGAAVERVSSIKFLSAHITEELTWSEHTTRVVKKAQQRLFFLRRLKRFGMDHHILRTSYTCTVESILTGSTYYGNCTAIERKALQRVVRTVQCITRVQLPNLLDLYTSRCLRRTRRVLKDSTHPSHCLFSQLPSGRRFRSSTTTGSSLTMDHYGPSKAPRNLGSLGFSSATPSVELSAVSTQSVELSNVATTSVEMSAVATTSVELSAVATPSVELSNVATTSVEMSAVATPSVELFSCSFYKCGVVGCSFYECGAVECSYYECGDVGCSYSECGAVQL